METQNRTVQPPQAAATESAPPDPASASVARLQAPPARAPEGSAITEGGLVALLLDQDAPADFAVLSPEGGVMRGQARATESSSTTALPRPNR